jgi:hypothetical protein
MPDPVAFVDIETTGLDPERHQIWEVGLILPDGTEHEWQLPVDLSRADPIALNIGRFHDRRVEKWKDSYEDAGWLGEFARNFVALTRDLHIAGAVVSFDAERLWRLLRANGECPMWHYHLIDVGALAAGFMAGKRYQSEADGRGVPSWEPEPPWKSNDLSMAVGVNPDDFDRHTALGDARWAKAIYEAVMGNA